MSNPVLNKIRLTAFLLIFILAGFFANQLLISRNEPIATSGDISSGASNADLPALEAPVTLPEFSLEDMNGTRRSIKEFTGKPLLINFWATWCAPCLREMPLLQSTWQARRASDDLLVIGIAVDDADVVAPYLEKTGVTYPILVGQADAMAATELFKPDYIGLPFTVFIDAAGHIVGSHSGELTPDQLAVALGALDALTQGSTDLATARQQIAR
ncbi:MAG: TlpA family protein disulfide reductase [Gammaproteobacteria bacterium]|nr:TlpA family protein disulfide reductase [Gammaproteobacteria bacterium]